MPKNADIIQLNAEYGDVIEAEYFRQRGIRVDMPPEKAGPPVWASAQRKGDDVHFKINGKVDEIIILRVR